jgi:hypothetical protein
MLREQPKQPTVPTALCAFDLDHLMRVVGERVVQAHQEFALLLTERPRGLVKRAALPQCRGPIMQEKVGERSPQF